MIRGLSSSEATGRTGVTHEQRPSVYESACELALPEGAPAMPTPGAGVFASLIQEELQDPGQSLRAGRLRLIPYDRECQLRRPCPDPARQQRHGFRHA